MAGGDALFGFGIASDIPVTGDWDGDGITDVGVVRNGKWYLDLNGNRNGTVRQVEILSSVSVPRPTSR